MKKIISWNVNGIRAVEKKGFIDWLLGCGADVVCIQELQSLQKQNQTVLRLWATAVLMMKVV